MLLYGSFYDLGRLIQSLYTIVWQVLSNTQVEWGGIQKHLTVGM